MTMVQIESIYHELQGLLMMLLVGARNSGLQPQGAKA